MREEYSFVFTGIRTFLLLGSLIYSCAATLPPSTKPPENYQGVIVESPLHQPDDYWIYQRADGSTMKVRARSYPMTIDFPLWLGRTWSYSRDSLTRMYTGPSNANRVPVEVTCEVTAFRPITVPAGSFDAFECNCNCRVPAPGHFEPECGRYTIWYAPSVKNVIQARGESTATALDLVEYKVGDKASMSTAIQEVAPKDVDGLHRLGDDYRARREYDRAIEIYTEAIRLDPRRAAAYIDRGNSYYNKKDYDRAIQDFTEAIELKPSTVAFNNRGNAYRARKDYERAFQDYNEAIRLDPNYAFTFNNRGNGYRERKDYERAIKDYDRAIQLNPSYALAFNNRGLAYSEEKNYDRALADYEAAARIDPQAAQHKRMGHTLFFLGRMAESAGAMERALKAAPQNQYAILWRYITRAKIEGQQAPARELTENAAKLKDLNWPTPVIDFYLGKIDDKRMFAAAENPEPKKNTEQICETNFYAAEAKLLKGATEEAIPLLRAAEKECPPTFYEAHGAHAELKRLGY
jgi:tetratricopeptide (TPR) repeat protein